MSTIQDVIYECVSTPRRSKIFEDESVIYAPDARRANRRQFNDDFINDNDNIFLEINDENEAVNPKDLKNSIGNIPRLSIGTRFLMTPKCNSNKLRNNKNKDFRESILSTATPRGRKMDFLTDFIYDNNNRNSNDYSDLENFVEEDISNLNNQVSNEEYEDKKYDESYSCFEVCDSFGKVIDNKSLIISNVGDNSVSFGKRPRYSPRIHFGNDSPSELIQIMKKTLKLN